MNLRATCLLLTATAVGQAIGDESSVDTSALRLGTTAEPISRTNPEYPADALRRQSEGWVWVSYVIQPTGSVSDILVKEVVGDKAFAKAASEVVKTWTYKPATWEGKPVEQCSNNTIIKFMLDPAIKGGRSDRMRVFRKIEYLIESNDIEQAQAQLKEVLAGNLTMYETAYFSLQGARIARLRGAIDDEVYYLRNAAVGDKLLGQQTSRQVLQRLFSVEAESGRFTDALETFEELKKYKEGIGDWDAYLKVEGQLLAFRDGDQPVVRAGVVPLPHEGEWSYWGRPLLKRSVEIGNAQGELGRIEFRCDRKYLSDVISPGRNWTLPDAWGQCDVYVFGKAGASFRLYEFPVTKSQATDAAG